MKRLEEKIGYAFKDESLLRCALTHTSYANEAKGKPPHNERLEFLGDSVLSFIVAEELYLTCGSLPEGELTRRRAALVCEAALAGFARQLGLGQHLLLGKGEEMSGGRERDSILADAFEALIAALYLDGGQEAAQAFILPFVRTAAAVAPRGDYKTFLQEVVQQNPEEKLRYHLAAETGPDHDKHFTVEVYLNSNCIGTGGGHSKKLAEQAAARAALALMGLVPEEEE
ncbi:ribonuclease III [Ruminococcaceae bacterium OttesenSCG-928-O06]|nr:ribonuclease III [Ruminococcaceae bacterium OttesenSCG-928-O06]